MSVESIHVATQVVWLYMNKYVNDVECNLINLSKIVFNKPNFSFMGIKIKALRIIYHGPDIPSSHLKSVYTSNKNCHVHVIMLDNDPHGLKYLQTLIKLLRTQITGTSNFNLAPINQMPTYYIKPKDHTARSLVLAFKNPENEYQLNHRKIKMYHDLIYNL